MVLATWWGWGDAVTRAHSTVAWPSSSATCSPSSAYDARAWVSRQAIRVALAADTLSILVMEVVDNAFCWPSRVRWSPH